MAHGSYSPSAVFPVHTVLLDVPRRTKEALRKHLRKPMYWRLLGTAYRFSPSTFGRLRRYDSLTTSFQNHLSSLSTDTLGLRKKCWTRQLFVRSDHFSITPPLYIVSTSPGSLCRLNLFLSPRNLVRLGGTGRCLFWPIFGQPLDVDMDLTRILCRTVHSPCPTKPRTANVSFKLQV